MDGGAWWATVHGVPKSQTRLSDFILLLWRAFSFFLPCHETCEILVSRSGFELGPPVVDVWSPNHWTTREVPEDHFVFTPPLPLICVLLHPYLSSTCSRPLSLLLEVASRPALTSEQASDTSSHCTGPCWHQQGGGWGLVGLSLSWFSPSPFDQPAWFTGLFYFSLALLSSWLWPFTKLNLNSSVV